MIVDDIYNVLQLTFFEYVFSSTPEPVAKLESEVTGGQLRRQLLQGRQLPNPFQISGCNPIKEV